MFPIQEFQTGGSLPGSVGFTYARTKGIPSEGPYAKKTLPSAQNGQEMRYYQNGLDWKPKGMRDGGWLDGYEKAQDGYTTGDKVEYGTPEYTEAYNRGEVVTDKGVRSPIALDEVVIQNNYKRPRGVWEQYADKIAEENKDAGLLGAIIGTPISAITSLPQLMGMKALTGEMQRPSEAMDIQNPYGAFAVDAIADPANLIGAGILTKENALARLAASKESGLLSNAYKLNPLALKEAKEAMLVRARPVGQDPYINMAESLRAKEAAGETLKWYQKNLLNPQTNPQMAAREKYFGQWFADNPSDLDFYINPETRNFADDAQIEILKARMPKSEAAKYNVKNFEDAKPLSNLQDTEYILPKDMVQQAERYSVDDLPKLMEEYNQINTPHWLQGYKEVPKQNSVQPSFIKQDLSEGNNIKYSFTNNQGNNIGTFSGKKSPEGIYVNSIEINPEFRRQGVASDIYKNIAKELQSKNEGTLFSRSSQHQFTDKDELGRSIAPANKLWENLVNKGEAEKFVEGMSHTYKIKPLKQGGIIKDDRGQWDYPGEITEINSPYITMQGVPYPVLGISDTGDTKLMKPGKDYKFKGKKVTEFPMAKNGLRQEQKGLRNLDDLTNFTNYNKSTGWLSKYE
jgi:hypothetical protein